MSCGGRASRRKTRVVELVRDGRIITIAPTTVTAKAVQMAFAVTVVGRLVPPVSALSPGSRPENATTPSANAGPTNSATTDSVRFSPAISTSSCRDAAPRARKTPDSVSRSSLALPATSAAKDRLATANSSPIASIRPIEIEAAARWSARTSSMDVIRWKPSTSCLSRASCASRSTRTDSASSARIESDLTGRIQ